MVPITPLYDRTPVFQGQTVASAPRQQLPFAEGQQFQALVRAQVDAGQYLLQINGEEILASSNTPVQVGQQLKLVVASLTPQITLQVLPDPGPPQKNTLTSTLPLLNLQPEFFSDIGQLNAGATPPDQLSAATRSTLSLFAAEATRSWPELPLTQSDSELPSGGSPWPVLRQGLLQLSRTQSLPTPTTDLAIKLATALDTLATNQESNPALEIVGNKPAIQTQAQDLLARLSQWAAGQGTADGWLNLLAQNVVSRTDSSATPLVQLFNLLSTISPATILQETSPEGSNKQETTLDGSSHANSLPQLETLLTRLGLSFERQLAGGHIEAAKQTLKYALLETAGQSSTNEPSHSLALRLHQTLELYQLLQDRLADASLAFLPLPFPFLQQGFLLIDQNDQEQQEAGPATDSDSRRLSLHVQLEGLGNMHIQMDWQTNNRLGLTFYAEAKDQAQYLAGFRDELAQWLTAADLQSVRFLVGTQNPMQTLLKALTAEGLSMVDTRA